MFQIIDCHYTANNISKKERENTNATRKQLIKEH